MENRTFGLLSAFAAVLWLGIIGLLHFIKPELDPRTRMISEYACGSKGWTMQLAFFSMAVSCWTLAAATWTHQPALGPALSIVCGFGLVGAGIFVTDPVLPIERTQTFNGALHIVCAFAVRETKSGWGDTRLAAWRPYFEAASKPSLADIRKELRRHLIESSFRNR